MLIRRCAVLFIEPRESLDFDLALLLQGQTGLRRRLQWFALAPHLVAEVEIDAAEREVLGAIGETQWSEREALEALHPRETIAALLARGLLIADAPDFAVHRERDEKLRDTFWRPLSAAAHFFSRWADVDAGDATREAGLRSTAELAERHGAPPTHFHSRRDTDVRIALPRPAPTALDQLLLRRATCRNFDHGRALDQDVFSHLMNRVFSAQAAVELAPDSAAVKKTSPSGGGLHPTEVYVLVQHVQDVAPGLYHYHSGDHALERLAQPEWTPTALRGLAQRCVAGQHWFADAHVQVMLGPRFKRSFWKYRNHAKAYRALVLDIGHLSQTLYLSATEFGLGAFITSAINELEIERAFGLDPLDEGPLAVCGFGWRAAERITVEFDPLQEVWK